MQLNQISFDLRVTGQRSFNGRFPWQPGWAGIRTWNFSAFCYSKKCGNNWTCQLQSDHRYQHTSTQFLHVGCPPCRPTTMSKHWRYLKSY